MLLLLAFRTQLYPDTPPHIRKQRVSTQECRGHSGPLTLSTHTGLHPHTPLCLYKHTQQLAEYWGGGLYLLGEEKKKHFWALRNNIITSRCYISHTRFVDPCGPQRAEVICHVCSLVAASVHIHCFGITHVPDVDLSVWFLLFSFIWLRRWRPCFPFLWLSKVTSLFPLLLIRCSDWKFLCKIYSFSINQL